MSNGVALAFDSLPSESCTGKTNGVIAIDAPPISAKWPEPISEAAFHGISGEYVRLVEPASEADTSALLLQFLVAAGNVIGHKP